MIVLYQYVKLQLVFKIFLLHYPPAERLKKSNFARIPQPAVSCVDLTRMYNTPVLPRSLLSSIYSNSKIKIKRQDSNPENVLHTRKLLVPEKQARLHSAVFTNDATLPPLSTTPSANQQSETTRHGRTRQPSQSEGKTRSPNSPLQETSIQST